MGVLRHVEAETERETGIESEERFEAVYRAIRRIRGGADAGLMAGILLERDRGSIDFVGLTDRGHRAVYFMRSLGYVAAFPFDETGVHGPRAEVLAREVHSKTAATTAIARHGADWIDARYRTGERGGE